jgi:hypothetical protein
LDITLPNPDAPICSGCLRNIERRRGAWLDANYTPEERIAA